MPLPSDLDIHALIRRAIGLARTNVEAGGAPFGALIADRSGQVVAEAANTTRVGGGISRHAEINAIEQAMDTLGGQKLTDHILVTSAEPCPMCAGAVFWAGLDTVIFSVSIPRIIALKGRAHQVDLACRDLLAHAPRPIEVIGPIFEDEGAVVFQP